MSDWSDGNDFFFEGLVGEFDFGWYINCNMIDYWFVDFDFYLYFGEVWYEKEDLVLLDGSVFGNVGCIFLGGSGRVDDYVFMFGCDNICFKFFESVFEVNFVYL